MPLYCHFMQQQKFFYFKLGRNVNSRLENKTEITFYTKT